MLKPDSSVISGQIIRSSKNDLYLWLPLGWINDFAKSRFKDREEISSSFLVSRFLLATADLISRLEDETGARNLSSATTARPLTTSFGEIINSCITRSSLLECNRVNCVLNSN